MWAISKQKVANFIGRMTQSMHLDTKKILTWYSYILFIAPILFWALIAMRSAASGQTVKNDYHEAASSRNRHDYCHCGLRPGLLLITEQAESIN